MKIHEFQAKKIFQSYQISVPNGQIAKNIEQALEVAKTLDTAGNCVVKAQVYAGGRGKAGGIKLCNTLKEVEEFSKTVFSKPLVTSQTNSNGQFVSCVLIEQKCDVDHEYYLSATIDRQACSIVIMASKQGGMDIEQVAAHSSDQILKVHVHPGVGFSQYQGRTLAFGLGLSSSVHKAFIQLVSNIVKLFIEKDCSLIEINPLVLTKSQQWIALDAKMVFDDNALFRQPGIQDLMDPLQEDPRDLEAAKWNVNYIHLNGNIGCIVNGAGLAMATMDMITFAGGQPANFLDVGGGASEERVREAFGLVLSDPNVKAIFVNIFGGIMRCDVLAQGIVQGMMKSKTKVPVIVRMEGTNVDKAKMILKESGIPITVMTDMKQAAEKAVSQAKGIL